MEEQVTFKGEFDNSQVLKGLEETIKLFQEAGDGSEDFETALSDLEKEFADLDKQQKNSVGSLMNVDREQRKATESSLSFGKAVKDQVRELRIFGKSVGDIEKTLIGKQKALRGVTTGLSASSKALRVFKLALISTGVGALVVALGSLVAFLTKTQDGIDKVNVVLDAAGTIVDNVVERFAKLGKAVSLLFDGDFQEAAKLARNSFKGIREEINEDIKASVKLTKERQAIRDAEIQLGVEYEKQKARIEELRNTGEDQSRSAGERTQALQQALEIENDITEKRIKLADRDLERIKERNSLGESLTEDIQAEADAETKLSQIKGESARQQREVANQLRSIQQQELQRIQQLQAAYNQFLNQLGQRVQQADLASVFGVDRLQKQRELAIQEINLFEQQVRDAAARAGRELPADFANNLQALFDEVQREFESGVKQIREGEDIGVTDLLTINPASVDNNAEEVGKRYLKGIRKAAENNLPLLDRLKQNVLDGLGIDDQELSELQKDFGAAFGNLIGSLDQLTQAQISQQDKLLTALDAQIEQTSDKLQEELQRREAGYANDAGALEEQIERQQAARQQAEEERARLEQQAARRRIIQNNIEQASNVVLAVTKLTAAESGKGLFGIITALAGLSLIFSLVAQAKNRANEFGTVPAFREGTDFVEGAGDGRSDSISAKLSRGERVLPSTLNEKLGGKAVSNKELVEYFSIGKAASDLMNVSNVSLPAKAMTQIVRDSKKTQAEIVKIKQELDLNVMRSAYEDAAKKSTDQLINYFKTRPVTYIDETGAQVSEVETGDKKIIRRAK